MYLSYDGLPLGRRVFVTNSGNFVLILGVMVVGQGVSGERAVLLLHPQHGPSVSCVGDEPADAEDRVSPPNAVTPRVCSFMCLTCQIHQREPRTLLPRKRPPSAPSSAGKHLGLRPAREKAVSLQTTRRA